MWSCGKSKPFSVTGSMFPCVSFDGIRLRVLPAGFVTGAHPQPTWTCSHSLELFQRFHKSFQRINSILLPKSSRTKGPQPHHHHMIYGRVISVLSGGVSSGGLPTLLPGRRRTFLRQINVRRPSFLSRPHIIIVFIT